MQVAGSILCWHVAEGQEDLAARGWVFGEQVVLQGGSDCQDSVAFGGVYRQS